LKKVLRMNRTCVALLLASACTGASSEPPEVKSELARDTAPAVSDAELAQLVEGNSAFAADLYRQVRTTDGNLFMSPLSISTALGMTYAGANGATATQMASALHFTLPPDRLHAALNKLDLELASRGQHATSGTIPFRLRTASSMWGQEGVTFQAPFLDTLAVNYGVGVHVLDFAADPEGSRETINTWVEDHTNHKIKDLLPQGSIDDLTRLVLTNAIYFSAAWNEPFEAAQTADRPFHLATGNEVAVPTLHQVHELGYVAGDGFAAAEIPYDGEKLSMVVVVPSGDLATFESSLTGATLAAITANLREYSVDLSLPKFKFEAPLGLKDTLQALGMVDAFTDRADLSGIDGTRNLAISDVLHKGFVAIDEKGTEAAAATAVIIGDTSVPELATLAVDRPFLFFIRDIPTGAILFIGRVVDPR
jgi:serpin B